MTLWIVLVGLGLIMMLLTAASWCLLLNEASWCLDQLEESEIQLQDEERRRLERIMKANHPPKAPGLHSRRIN